MAQSSTDGHRDLDIDADAAFKPASRFAFGPLLVALFSLSLEVIGVMAVSVASAVWYANELVGGRSLAVLGYVLTIMLPNVAILGLLFLTCANAYKARAFSRLHDHGVLVMSDAKSFSWASWQSAIIVTLFVQILLVGIASVLDFVRGGMSVFEMVAKWGAVAACSFLLILRTWETASATHDSASVRDDASFAQYKQKVNSLVLVREQLLDSWLVFDHLLAEEYRARNKAEKAHEKAHKDIRWAHPLDPLDFPRLNFNTIVDQVNARTPLRSSKELFVLLEATKLGWSPSTSASTAHSMTKLNAKIVFLTPLAWALGFSRAVDAGDIAFNKTLRNIMKWAIVAFFVAFVGSGTWYISEALS
ncbi:hypothetical protein T492DRAFT_1009740 [Pavlovales sp. CCMP2436]|nr:hypothetical protein T492DRAFT_1009740 [Pavlovales sp. CCMP2436]